LVDAQFTSITVRFSPDGRSIVYSSNESGKNEVAVRRFDLPRELRASRCSSPEAAGKLLFGAEMAKKSSTSLKMEPRPR